MINQVVDPSAVGQLCLELSPICLAAEKALP
jgi:hypothetical protein